MEYLMTYGWAILIIAVVLGALFALGFFNSANLAPKVGPGSCQVYRPQGPGTTTFINTEGACSNELPQYVAQFNGAEPATTAASVIEAAYSPSYSFGNGPFTISAWIRMNSVLYVIPTIFSTRYPAGNGIIFGERYGGALFVGYNGVLTYQASSGASVLDGRWHNALVTRNSGGTVTYYIDGVSSGSFIASDNVNGGAMDIGVDWPNWGQTPFNGMIANVQVYNASFSANDVQALYQEGIGGAPILLNNLVGWWPLNGNANDYSGNLNNGVPINLAYTGAWTPGYTVP